MFIMNTLKSKYDETLETKIPSKLSKLMEALKTAEERLKEDDQAKNN